LAKKAAQGTTMDIVSASGKLEVGVLVHGGAGHVEPDRRPIHEAGCREGARAGWAVLSRGGSALDAAQAAARLLEDLPQFNAGTGGALTADGGVELDASIMDGRTLRAGAVAAVRGFKNPIDLARAVLSDARHVLLCAEGAARFAERAGIAAVDQASLVTEHARAALERVKSGEGPKGWAGGTIGAVARDAQGHVAAATSTGGTVGKLPGRIGDSPIVGAGTLADDEVAAISATGDGEGILLVGFAQRIAHALAAGVEIEAALASALDVLLRRGAATGGAIVIDKHGRYAWARSTSTMSWALCSGAGEDGGS
jgi:beta-aspartyl-peptidase (threonine type)